MSEEYRIEVKVKNNNILKLIEKAGYSTVNEFCRLNTTLIKDVSRLGDLINLKTSPLNSKAEYTPIVYRICDVLGCFPEDLFTETQMHTALKTNKRVLKVNEAEMQFSLENISNKKSLEQILDYEDLKQITEDALKFLQPRVKKIISMVYGLNEEDTHTYKQIGAHFEISEERVRQIVSKALRELRHPDKSKNLKQFI